METELINLCQQTPEEQLISCRRAGELLRFGSLVAFPTETVYGLGANALDPEASSKIYAAKGRPSDNPLIVHIADWEAIETIAEGNLELAKKLSDAFWPGPLTMILPKKDCVPLATTGGLSTVAIRMPSHEIARTVIRFGGGYIAAPSANASGRPSPTTAGHVYEDMKGIIPMILDQGEVSIGLESTIIDLTEQIPTILRPGYITLSMLSDCIGEVRMDPGLSSENTAVRPKAPGMRYRHYAPKAPLVIVEGPASEVIRAINARTASCSGCGVIATEETKDLYTNAEVSVIGSRSDEESIAHNLYDILRGFDHSTVTRIYSESFDTPSMGTAIMNRLIKAAGHQVISAADLLNEL